MNIDGNKVTIKEDITPVVRLENWSVGTDPFASPEMNIAILWGEVYGHPLHRDGKTIHTSQIKEANGLIVKTHNTTYKLGEVDPGYKEWCEKHNINLDLENPITIKNAEEV